MKKHLLLFLVIVMLLGFSCKKETPFTPLDLLSVRVTLSTNLTLGDTVYYTNDYFLTHLLFYVQFQGTTITNKPSAYRITSYSITNDFIVIPYTNISYIGYTNLAVFWNK